MPGGADVIMPSHVRRPACQGVGTLWCWASAPCRSRSCLCVADATENRGRCVLTRARLDDQRRALWAELGMTVLFVTHAITEAAYLAERAVVLSRRPGLPASPARAGRGAARGGIIRARCGRCSRRWSAGAHNCADSIRRALIR
jgi:hypothetical protein